jgi:hypothetical protein
MKFPWTKTMAKTMCSDIKKIKGWIDANPEYLLVLVRFVFRNDAPLTGERERECVCVHVGGVHMYVCRRRLIEYT